jgi:endoglucanase
MNSDQMVTAQFDLAPDLVTLTVSTSGRGGGRVTSLPIGISCGDICQATFPRNTVVTLAAAPDDFSAFDINIFRSS